VLEDYKKTLAEYGINDPDNDAETLTVDTESNIGPAKQWLRHVRRVWRLKERRDELKCNMHTLGNVVLGE
jgi:hypothetical protein